MVLRRCEILLLKKNQFVLIEKGLSQSEVRSKEEICPLPLSPRREIELFTASRQFFYNYIYNRARNFKSSQGFALVHLNGSRDH